MRLYLVVDGIHEALISEEVWEQAQSKVLSQAKKYEKVNRDKSKKISGGADMKNAMQLKAVIKNIAKDKHISAQLVMQ